MEEYAADTEKGIGEMKADVKAQLQKIAAVEADIPLGTQLGLFAVNTSQVRKRHRRSPASYGK